MSRKRPKTREYIQKKKHKVVHLTADDKVTFRSVRGHDDIFSMRDEAIYASIELLEYYNRQMILDKPQLARIEKLAKNLKRFDINEAHANIQKKPK